MNEKIEQAINEQINNEIWSANLYLSLQAYFERQQLTILSFWLGLQAQSNMERVYKMLQQLYSHGGYVTIDKICRKPENWISPQIALNKLIEHERYMAEQIRCLLFLSQHIDTSLYMFINQLYSHRVYVTNIFMELLHILAKESRGYFYLNADNH